MEQRPEDDSLAFDYVRGRVDDRLEIADLLHRYAYHFDRNEPALVAELFTDDAVIDYGPEVEPIRGRAAIVGRIGPGLERTFVATSHHVSNVLVRFAADDAAHAVAYVYAWHRYHDRPEDGHLWGQYHVSARRTDAGWRMSRLVLRTVAVTNFHRQRMHPIGRRESNAGR
jgi:uncharacterized protein (TIGR02246 family)